MASVRTITCGLYLLCWLLGTLSQEDAPIRWKRHRLLGSWYGSIWNLHFRRKHRTRLQAFHPLLGRPLLLLPLLCIILRILLLIQCQLQEWDWPPFHANVLDENRVHHFLLCYILGVPRRAGMVFLQENVQGRRYIRRSRNATVGGQLTVNDKMKKITQ